ncbi:MAG: hypothetical protein MK137_07520 [Rickettsiales bacterium]|nr:hypothetical protein [Rickettsiales bacterium]
MFKILLKQPLISKQHNALYNFRKAHANKEFGFRAAMNQEPEDAWAAFLKRRGYRGNYKHLLQGAMTIRNHGSYRMIYPQDNALRLVIAQAELQQKLQRTKGITADLDHPKVSKDFSNIFDQKFLDSLVSSSQNSSRGLWP